LLPQSDGDIMSWFEQVTSKHKVLFNATSLPRDAKAQTVQRRVKAPFPVLLWAVREFFSPFWHMLFSGTLYFISTTSEVKEMDAGSSNGAGVGRSRHTEAGENASVSR